MAMEAGGGRTQLSLAAESWAQMRRARVLKHQVVRAVAQLCTCTLKVIELYLQNGVNCIVYKVYLKEAFKGNERSSEYSRIQTIRAIHLSSFVDSTHVTSGDMKVWPFIPTSASPQTVCLVRGLLYSLKNHWGLGELLFMWILSVDLYHISN